MLSLGFAYTCRTGAQSTRGIKFPLNDRSGLTPILCLKCIRPQGGVARGRLGISIAPCLKVLVVLRGAVASRVLEAVTMFVVAALSLLLLLYVGFGDGRRNYELIHIEKLTAHGRFLQNSIENFLRDGLPLKQYVGFSTLAASIVDSEDVDAVAVYDQSGKQLFIAVDKHNPALPPSAFVKNPADGIKIHVGDTHYQVVLPLRTRFETVGSVVVVSPKRLVAGRMRVAFLPLLITGGVLAGAF